MERIVQKYQNGVYNLSKSVEEVGKTAFNDVISRFHTIGSDKKSHTIIFTNLNMAKV